MSDHDPGRARRLAVDVAGVIPGRIDRVAERAPQVGVDGDHWLVIELGGPRLGDEVRVHPGLPSVGRPADRHGGAVDRTAAAEENHDPAVIDVAFRVPGDARIGAEVEPVVGPRGRQRKIDTTPGLAAVGGREGSHGQSIDLVRSGHDLARVARVYGDRGLALGTIFVAGVHIRTDRHTMGLPRGRPGHEPGRRNRLKLRPPGRERGVAAGGAPLEHRAGRAGQYTCQDEHNKRSAHWRQTVPEHEHPSLVPRPVAAVPLAHQRARQTIRR